MNSNFTGLIETDALGTLKRMMEAVGANSVELDELMFSNEIKLNNITYKIGDYVCFTKGALVMYACITDITMSKSFEFSCPDSFGYDGTAVYVDILNGDSLFDLTPYTIKMIQEDELNTLKSSNPSWFI